MCNEGCEDKGFGVEAEEEDMLLVPIPDTGGIWIVRADLRLWMFPFDGSSSTGSG